MLGVSAGAAGSYLSSLPVIGTTQLVKKNAELRDQLRLRESEIRQYQLHLEQVGKTFHCETWTCMFMLSHMYCGFPWKI